MKSNQITVSSSDNLSYHPLIHSLHKKYPMERWIGTTQGIHTIDILDILVVCLYVSFYFGPKQFQVPRFVISRWYIFGPGSMEVVVAYWPSTAPKDDSHWSKSHHCPHMHKTWGISELQKKHKPPKTKSFLDFAGVFLVVLGSADIFVEFVHELMPKTCSSNKVL